MVEHNYKDYPELTNKQIEEFGFQSPHKQITEDFRAVVVKVTDGDTIRVKANFRDFAFPIRFIAIDAPEMNHGGEVARDWLKGQIEGEEVEIKINVRNRVGKYGRLLGKVVAAGIDMGESEVRLGLAVPFGQKDEAKIPDPFKIFRIEQWL